LFLALELSADVREAMGALQRRLREGHGGWRWTRTEGLHLTIRFLGEVDPDLDARGRPRWAAAAAGVPAFRLRFSRLGRLPPRGRPRVLCVEAEDGEGRATSLAERVEQVAHGLGFEPERRRFHPHLTLARAARGGRPELPESLGLPHPLELSVDALVLLRSQLDPAGARYTMLESFPLAGARDG